jgi:hypothetical protein
VETLLVRGVPAQLDGVFGALTKSRGDFAPKAAYTAPQDRLLDWILAEDFSSSPADPPPAPKNPAEALLNAPDSFNDIVEMSTGPAPKVFAHRGPQLALEVLDQFFPIPENLHAAIDGEEAAKLKPDQTVLVLFILIRGQ